VTDSEVVRVRYANPFALMRDLRAMGLTNALHDRRRRPLRRTTLVRAASLYGERFADPDGRIAATFELVWLSGWAPHESQQKPLQPGSARMRLADALGATERRAGQE
jgi:alkylation response protein AidB-like acyl-CoA dehydrogenase